MAIYRAVVYRAVQAAVQGGKKKTVMLKGYSLNSELNARAYKVKYPK